MLAEVRAAGSYSFRSPAFRRNLLLPELAGFRLKAGLRNFSVLD